MSGRLNRISWTNCLRIASWLMLGIALGLLLYAQWIPAKALLAQQLIQRTWAAHRPQVRIRTPPAREFPLPGLGGLASGGSAFLEPGNRPLSSLTGVEGASLAFGPGLHPQGAQPNEKRELL